MDKTGGRVGWRGEIGFHSTILNPSIMYTLHSNFKVLYKLAKFQQNDYLLWIQGKEFPNIFPIQENDGQL